MNKRSRFSLPWLGLAVLAAALALGGLACTCAGGRRTPTPTPPMPTAKPLATATRVPPTLAPTKQAAPTQTVPQPTAAPKTPETLTLRDPKLEDVPGLFEDLDVGAKFELVLTEDYVTQQALAYLDSATDLPMEIQDVAVKFDDEIVTINALIPLGFLRVDVQARGRWWAKDCQFQAEIIDLKIGGGAAPASLREQIEPWLIDGLKASTSLPACFTEVAIGDGELTVRGYKK
ncbi:MAG: hypothetical protein GXY76_03200 [Chloroflexi bacterium]|nr:hypothetical protein [Chloroflexota bacterium]